MTSDQPSVSCGNASHPDGPWHPATPLPASWQWRKRWRYRRNVRGHGCGCDRRLGRFSGGQLDEPKWTPDRPAPETRGETR
jgi:hypothetical protein